MAVIQVKYLPPTVTKGSRLKAFAAGKSHTRGFHFSSKNDYEKAWVVAMELKKILEWDESNDCLGGQLQNGDYVFIFD